MRKTMLFGFVLLASCAANAGSATNWTYSGEEGPHNWAKQTEGSEVGIAC